MVGVVSGGSSLPVPRLFFCRKPTRFSFFHPAVRAHSHESGAKQAALEIRQRNEENALALYHKKINRDHPATFNRA